jgi:hypothetical protein
MSLLEVTMRTAKAGPEPSQHQAHRQATTLAEAGLAQINEFTQEIVQRIAPGHGRSRAEEPG